MTVARPNIPLMRPLLPTAEALLPYLREIDDARWYSNFGPMVDRFEYRLASVLGLDIENLVCVASGTIGLTTCLRALDAPVGSYCLMPSWTFTASALAVKWSGMEPYFLDVDEASWMLNPDHVAQSIPEIDREIGAVMPVSAFGAPVGVEAWDKFRKDTGIPVVIDAAAGFDGAAFGAAPAMISLHATKVFGVGEGALIACRDLALAGRIRALSNFGFAGKRESELVGINAKISEYTAAVGMAALDRWPKTRAAFGVATERYQDAFADVQGIALAPGLARTNLRSTFNVRLVNSPATEFMAVLEAEGIATRQWWGLGCHRMPAFRETKRMPLPVTEALAASVVGLPFSQDMHTEQFLAVREASLRALNR